MRFYGFAPEYIMSLPMEDYGMYIWAMDAMEATEQLNRIQAACFPEMSKHNRQKISDALKRATILEQRSLTHEDMEVLLNG